MSTPDRSSPASPGNPSAEDLELLHQLMEDGDAPTQEETSTSLDPISRVPRTGEGLPVSFAQRRMWVQQQMHPRSVAYNVPAARRLQGDLNVSALRSALQAVVLRHEPLRTTFRPGPDGEPLQHVHPVNGTDSSGIRDARCLIVDLEGLSDEKQGVERERRVRAAARRPFDLERRVFRSMLLRCSPTEHVLSLVTHHVATDGWSMRRLSNEIVRLYQSFADGGTVEDARLPQLSIQYADYAAWQRERSGNSASLDYWMDRLQEVEPLQLSTDYRRPATFDSRGQRVHVDLPADLVARLREMAAEEKTTLFTVLLFGFRELLRRYSGQDNFAIGTPTVGRNREELEALVGSFVSVLPIRTTHSANDTWTSGIRKTRDAILEAQEHMNVPIEHILDGIGEKRTSTRHPVYQVLFQTEMDAPKSNDVSAAGLTSSQHAPPNVSVQQLGSTNGQVKFDILLSVVRTTRGTAVNLRYATALFDRTTAEQMVRHYRNLLIAAVASPDRLLSRVSMQSDEERKAVRRWSRGPHRADGALVLDQVRSQARATPDRVAVVGDRNAHLTYEGLVHRAACLGRILRSKGAAPETPAAILTRPSVHQVAALLAVWNVGAVAVPLRADAPRPQLRGLLREAAPAICLTDSATASLTDELDVGRVLHVDAGESETGGDPLPEIASVFPEQAAYRIYTSGSTGRPKGVVVEHRHLAAYTSWAAGEYHTGMSTCSVVHTPISVDLSLTSLLLPLMRGGQIRMVDISNGDVEPLRSAMPTPGSNALLKMTPSHLQALAAARTGGDERDDHSTAADAFAEDTESRRPSRLFVVGGEALTYEHIREGTHPSDRIVNEYGPTETVVGVVRREVRREDRTRQGPVPIGSPAPGVGAYVLSSDLRPVAPGVPGELYLSGDQVSRGYADRPRQTAAAFVPDPFLGAKTPGARMYRTRDRVRWVNGELEFLGRVDRQIKIRGYRVEPGDVESKMEALEGVRQAAVRVKSEGHAPGSGQLIGYVVPAVADSSNADVMRDVRSQLQGRLPEAMVPTHIVVLEKMPLTRSGKVDYDALPSPDRGEDATRETPRTKTEQTVAEIWREVLGVDAVGRTEDFFALGGHSIRAIQIAARVQKEMGVSIPMRTVFEQPTIAEFGRFLDDQTPSSKAQHPISRIERTGRGLPVSFAQRRMWFLQQMEPDQSAYNVPVARRLKGRLDVPALQTALRESIRRHEPLRTTFQPGPDGEPRQHIREMSGIPTFDALLPVVDLTRLPDGERQRQVQRHVRTAAQQPFDLGKRVFRATLLRCSETDHVLSLVMHHVATDEWSMEVLTRDIVRLYDTATEAETDHAERLEELSVQYADYAYWQREHVDLASSLDYWADQLRGVEPLNLPTDRSRPASFDPHAETVEAPLSDEALRDVRRLARDAGTTPFTVLIAAFQVLMHRWSGQTNFAVGTPIFGRDREVLEPLVGCLVNTIALRASVADAMKERKRGFRSLVDRVRDQILEAQSHQSVPFEHVVDAVEVDRSPSRHPIFQVMFQADLASTRPATGGDESANEWRRSAFEDDVTRIEVRPVEASTHQVKFDLQFSVSTRGGDSGDEAGVVSLRFATALFDRSTAKQVLGHYRRLLAAAASSPRQPVSELTLHSPTDLRKLRDWERGDQLESDTDEAARKWSGMPAPARIEARRQEVPDRVAVVGPGGGHCTYAALSARAHRLAAALRNRGVGPETPVAVVLPRSPDQIVAMLATWAVAGVVVPLSTDTPPGRLRTLLHEAGAPLCIAAPDWDHAGRNHDLSASMVSVADLAHEGPRAMPPAPAPNVEAAQAAYRIYTSGSTGTPKGVVVEHRHLAAQLDWVAAEAWGLEEAIGDGDASKEMNADGAPVAPPSRMLQKTPVGFDASVWEWVGPLAMGATLVQAPNGAHRQPSVLRTRLTREQITHLQLVPAQLALVLESVGTSDPSAPNAATTDAAIITEYTETAALRWLYTGGEALTRPLLRRARRWLGVGTIRNLYGPTETTINATSWTDEAERTIDGEALEKSGVPVPIGRPVAETSVYVVGPQGRRVGPGVPGEICIGGAQVSRGYIGDARRTAQQFVPDPWTCADGSPGARMYRTGDRGRWVGGALHFLGRVDRQVKIRGHRTEPGAVEARMAAVPGVGQAAVRVVEAPEENEGTRAAGLGGPRLIGYVVPEGGETKRKDTLSGQKPRGDETELATRVRQALGAEMPQAMVPEVVVERARLPLSPSGKVDYAALPVPESGTSGPPEEPQTPTEQQLAAIWAEVLGVETVGRTDDFFALGGHSLLAMQVTARVQDRIGVDVRLNAIFANPILLDFARTLDTKHEQDDPEPLQLGGAMTSSGTL